MKPFELQTFVYGGCVAGDVAAMYQPHSFKVVRYVARQSLLSAFSCATEYLPTVKLDSSFQTSMAWGDIEGNLFPLISDDWPFDMMLWDLNIERCGVWILGDGTTVTNSPELRRSSGMLEEMSKGVFLGFSSSRHFESWSLAAKRFEQRARGLGMKSPIFVLAVDWATHDEYGKRTSRNAGMSASAANRKFARYYSQLEDLGFTVLRFDNVVADSNHKWGPAPFHYSRSTYEQIYRRIQKELTNQRG